MDDKELLKKVASLLLRNLMGVELDLLIYRGLFAAMKLHGVPLPDIGSMMAEARKTDSPEWKLVTSKYAETLRNLQQFGETAQDKALLDLLKSWKPSDPAN